MNILLVDDDRFVIAALEKNIDWESLGITTVFTANDIGKAMEELLDFDRTLGDVLQWAAADGHTLVVVTADHATGALTLQDGDLAEGRIGVAFGNDSHNGIAVPVYAWGPGSDAFTGIRENAQWGALIASFVK